MMAWMVEATRYPFGYVKPPDDIHVYNEKTGERIRYVPEVMHITTGEPEHIYESETCNGEITAALGPREEIIRCRDCKHYIPEKTWQEERAIGLYETVGEPPSCKKWSFEFTEECLTYRPDVKPDGFCAWAERDA